MIKYKIAQVVNSNYGGGDYQREKAAQKAGQTEKTKLPTWLKICLGILFTALVDMTTLVRLTVPFFSMRAMSN